MKRFEKQVLQELAQNAAVGIVTKNGDVGTVENCFGNQQRKNSGEKKKKTHYGIRR